MHEDIICGEDKLLSSEEGLFSCDFDGDATYQSFFLLIMITVVVAIKGRKKDESMQDYF